MKLKLELDHCGVAVMNLEAGRTAYARLGFALTLKSLHSGSRSPGAPVEPWGSGNHCAIFREGYLELIGLTDPTLYSSVKGMLERYEGTHIVAIGCSNAETAHAELRKRGHPVGASFSLERDAAYGPGNGEIRRARFRNIYVDRQKFPEARFNFIQHLTREVLWQPHLLKHPNGVLGIDECWLAAPDARATAAKIARLYSARPAPIKSGWRIPLDRGAVLVVDEPVWRRLLPETALPRLPAPVGLGFKVESLVATAACLAENDVRFGRNGDAIAVLPGEACGTALRFHE